MPIEPLTQSTHHRNDHEWYNGSGKNRMRDENSEVQGADPSLAMETDGADFEMVNQIGNEEHR